MSQKKAISPPTAVINQKASLCGDTRTKITDWLTQNAHFLPDFISEALTSQTKMLSALEESHYKLKSYLRQLRLAMGITPSSEKRSKSSAQKSKRNPKTVEEWDFSKSEADRLCKLHEKLARRHRQRGIDLDNNKPVRDLDDIELPAEELAEIELKVQAFSKDMDIGGVGRHDEDLSQPVEAFEGGLGTPVLDEEVKAEVTPEQIGTGQVVDRQVDTRTRFSLCLAIVQHNISVEKVMIQTPDGERTMVSASLAECGPPGFSVTWDFFPQLALLAAQYSMPFNRLAQMLSSDEKIFTSSQMVKYFTFMAHRFVPVYLHLFKQLAQSDVFSGDDTKTRVIEVQNYFKKKASVKNSSEDEITPPWYLYSTKDLAKKHLLNTFKPKLGLRLAHDLGFVAQRRQGLGQKIGFQTSVISGRADPKDFTSEIIFYRSHFGGLGNLLEELLKLRDKNRKTVWIQADFSSVNLIFSEDLKNQFHIRYAGCAAHARRPFKIHENDDPIRCEHMLALFDGIFHYERSLTSLARNHQNVPVVRRNHELPPWQEVKSLAETMVKKHPPKTPLGAAAQYILTHYDKLIAYVDNPRISATNNFSERMLRKEKLIEKNSLFRTSLEGRFALDIVRTILQTAVAARADVNQYLLHLVKADPDEVSKHPEKYTPHYFVKNNSQL